MKHFIRITTVALLFVSAASMTVPNVSAQEATPTPQSESEVDNGGFFSDFRIGDAISTVSIVGVGILGIWLIRIQGARMQLLKQSVQSAKDELDNERKRCQEEIEIEHRHTQRLREQHQAAEELLQHQVEDAKRRAGIGPAGQLSATKTELPEDLRTSLLEAVSLLKEMKAGRLEAEAAVPPSAEVVATQHLRQGNAYYAAADYERAVHEYTSGLEMQPNDATLLHNRGTVLLNLERSGEALADYDRSLQLRRDDPDTLMGRGAALAFLARHQEALVSIDRSLQLRPDDPDTLMNRGNALLNLGRYEEALAVYNGALQLRPDDPGFLMGLGAAVGALGRHEEALAAFDRSLELRPDHPQTVFNRGNALGQLGRQEEALATFDRALQLRPDHPATLFNRACAFSLSNKPDEAIEDLRRAIAGDSKLRQNARANSAFNNIRDDPRFQELVGEDETQAEESADS